MNRTQWESQTCPCLSWPQRGPWTNDLLGHRRVEIRIPRRSRASTALPQGSTGRPPDVQVDGMQEWMSVPGPHGVPAGSGCRHQRCLRHLGSWPNGTSKPVNAAPGRVTTANAAAHATGRRSACNADRHARKDTANSRACEGGGTQCHPQSASLFAPPWRTTRPPDRRTRRRHPYRPRAVPPDWQAAALHVRPSSPG